MKFKTLFLVIFILGSLFSQSQNITVKTIDGWIYLGKDKDSNSFYMKETPVSSLDGIIKIWTKNTAKKEKIGDKTYKNVTLMMLNEFDCASRKTRLLSIVYYNSSDQVITSFDYNEYEAEWFNVIPETMGESIMKKSCKLFR